MRFNPNLLELIPTSQLDADFGGQNHYEFEPRSYWDQIVAYVPFHTFTSLFRSTIQKHATDVMFFSPSTSAAVSAISFFFDFNAKKPWTFVITHQCA